MLIPPSFGQMISARRVERGLTKTRLGRLLGIDRRRIADIEGDKVPPAELIRLLAKVLGIRAHRLLDAARNLQLARADLRKNGAAFERAFGERKDFFPHRDRDNGIRLAAARKHYPWIVEDIIGRLRRRRDYPVIQHFLRLICIESRLEFLFVLLLLDWGAKPLLAAPTCTGAAQLRLVDPINREYVGHRKFPGLGLRYRGAAVVVVPQVSFEGGSERPRVDFMFCLPGRQLVVETDGAEKEPSPDRDQMVGLQIIRLNETDLLLPKIVPTLLDRILAG